MILTGFMGGKACDEFGQKCVEDKAKRKIRRTRVGVDGYLFVAKRWCMVYGDAYAATHHLWCYVVGVLCAFALKLISDGSAFLGSHMAGQ